jgi:hypothetical protein
MSSYRPNLAGGMTASPIPIRRRRRDSMFSDSDSEAEGSDYYRQVNSRPVASHRNHEPQGHQRHHTHGKERGDSLPRHLRQSPSPDERGHRPCSCHDCQEASRRPHYSHHAPAHGSDGQGACHGCHHSSAHDPHGQAARHGHHHHGEQDGSGHRHGKSSCGCDDCSPPAHNDWHQAHHCDACQNAQSPPSNSYAHRPPARQVTFQSLPPPREPMMRSMNVPPPGGHSTFLGPMPSHLQHQPHPALLPAADYTTMSNMSGMNVQTMPFASPHVATGNGAGYPNAMPLSSSIEVLPRPGQYGAPKYATFAKPGERPCGRTETLLMKCYRLPTILLFGRQC